MSDFFEPVYRAWCSCSRRKRKSAKAQCYECNLLDNLVSTAEALERGSWQPHPPVCFTVAYPKAREIHAAEYSDRVVHHYLVPLLEEFFEPQFIHDVYSNRVGKGTHAAVDRLQQFMRSQEPQKGYFLQLDIRNFFNTIDRRILFKQLQKGLNKAVRKNKVTPAKATELRNLGHTILKQDIASVALYRGSRKVFSQVPKAKRLGQVGEYLGLPIGNLSSQFFANVYLDGLDQFVKHQLKCRQYIRYVDDFILLHNSSEQLRIWQRDIQYFLNQKLGLSVKDNFTLAPVSNGADFLGYITRPHYRLVRRRVVHHFREKLNTFAALNIKQHKNGLAEIDLSVEKRDKLMSVMASYLGHYKHAKHYRLLQRLFSEYYWLAWLFNVEQGRLIRLWEPRRPTRFRTQINFFQYVFPYAELNVQKGYRQQCLKALKPCTSSLECPTVLKLIIKEQGFLKGGLKRRCIEKLYFNRGTALCV